MVNELTDYEIISMAVRMWKNHIQTGDVNLSVQDAKNCGKESMINKLDSNQEQFTKRLEKISSRALEINSQKKIDRM